MLLPVLAALALAAVSSPRAPNDVAASLSDEAAAPSSKGGAAAPPRAGADTAARDAAQRGLDALVRSAVAWQEANKCYGCHVQAVTLEAITVGRAHGYRVDDRLLGEILHGMLDGPGGQRGPNGFSVGGAPGHLIETSTAFGGAALAHYDERLSPALQRELTATAEKLLAFQSEDGAVQASDQRRPVCAGLLQSTTQALITWRQAQARTADTRWLVPIRRAEAYLTQQGKRFSDERPEDLQDVAHAIIGLRAAGRGGGDRLLVALARVLERAQHDDGGFGFTRDAPSSAYMTGQALYALRLAGRADQDRAVQRGTRWLVAQQAPDGGWGGGGFAKAESMWAVLGLVSIDQLSLQVAGLQDGGRLEGARTIIVRATDNGAARVAGIEVFVDDVRAAQAAGATLTTTLDAARLANGAHIIDVVARNDRGGRSARRFVVHAGESWLADVGARYQDGRTVVSFRELMPAAKLRRVSLAIVEAREAQGSPVKGDVVATLVRDAVEGPMAIAWDGAGARGARFFAVLTLRDEAGRVRDVEEVLFTHVDYAQQRAQFAEVQGNVAVDGRGLSANTAVELVDDEGRVVQRTTTTRSGQYRFQNVDAGKYKVRVKKQGFKEWEADVAAERAQESVAPAAALSQ